MKPISKLMIAISLTLALGLIGLNAWAAPTRQGTVPQTPDISTIEGLIPVTGGCFQVTLLGGCESVGTIKHFDDPGKQIGPANIGLKFLTDAIKIELDGVCDAEICFPYPEQYEEKGAEIYKWNEVTELWDKVESKVSGDPAQICAVEGVEKETAYTVLGN